MATLNSNQVATILNEAFAQATGAEQIDTLDLHQIIDRGNNSDVIGSVEQFTKALLNVLVKYWFTDSSYRSEYSNPFYQDSERFGAILEAISIDYPEVQNSHCWQDFTPTVDAQTGEITYVTIGTYEVRTPKAHAKFYGSSSSWEICVSITGTQWDSAFRSESELRKFVDYIFLIVDNALIAHIEDMDNANRNGLIASKLAYAASQGATGVHVINLVKAYQESLATQTDMTVEAFLNDEDGLRFAAEEMRKYIAYMRKMSVLFNVAGKKRFIPRDREVVQILEAFKLRLERVALTDAFRVEFSSLPLSQSVPFWQGFGTGATFDEVSAIDISLDGSNDITQTGVVGLIADQWACLHTIVQRRTAAKVFEPEDITNYYYQYQDRYMIDDTQNALVFIVDDYEAPTDEGGGGDGGEGGGGS